MYDSDVQGDQMCCVLKMSSVSQVEVAYMPVAELMQTVEGVVYERNAASMQRATCSLHRLCNFVM